MIHTEYSTFDEEIRGAVSEGNNVLAGISFKQNEPGIFTINLWLCRADDVSESLITRDPGNISNKLTIDHELDQCCVSFILNNETRPEFAEHVSALGYIPSLVVNPAGWHQVLQAFCNKYTGLYRLIEASIDID